MNTSHQKGQKVPYALSLTPWHMRLCRRWGFGNASEGARLAIEEREERLRKEEPRLLAPLEGKY